MSMSLSPELLTLKALGETVGSAGEGNAGERIKATEDVLDTGDAARSSASSRSRRSLVRVNLRHSCSTRRICWKSGMVFRSGGCEEGGSVNSSGGS